MLHCLADVTADDVAHDEEDDGLHQVNALGKGKHFQIAHKFGGNADFISHYLGYCIGFQWKNPFCEIIGSNISSILSYFSSRKAASLGMPLF